MPRPDECEVTKWHSRQKHAFLEAYFRIWTENVGRKKGVVAPSLAIVDLNAAYGWCHNPDLNDTWAGTAVLSAACLRDYRTDLGRRLVLNSYHPDDEEQAVQLKALTKAISETGVIESGCSVSVASEPLDAAVDRAMRVVKPEYPNIWILDPYKPDALPWSTVERIVRFSGTYQSKRTGETIRRRPELFISLMTSALQRNVDENPKIVTTALGMPEDQWRAELDRLHQDLHMNNFEGLVSIYSRKLSEFYQRTPLVIKVPGTTGNIVYTVIFCSEHDAGYHMIRQKGLPEYETWREREWVRPAREVAETKKEKRKLEKSGHTFKPLGDFDLDKGT